jgi:excisionase family DNA binding protein
LNFPQSSSEGFFFICNNAGPAKAGTVTRTRAQTKEHTMYESQYHRLPAVSKMTGVSIDFLRKEIRRGTLSAVKLGRSITIPENDLRDYLAARKVQATGHEAVAR